MTYLFQVSVFLHVVAALTLFFAFTLEWMVLDQLKRAATVEAARSWAQSTAKLPAVVGASLLILLATGIFLGMVTQMFALKWFQTAFVMFILIGAVSGRAARRLRELRAGSGGATRLEWFRMYAGQSSVLVLIWLQLAMTVGIVFLMTAHPGGTGSIAWAVGSIVVGILLGATAKK